MSPGHWASGSRSALHCANNRGKLSSRWPSDSDRCRPCPAASRNDWATCFSRIGNRDDTGDPLCKEFDVCDLLSAKLFLLCDNFTVKVFLPYEIFKLALFFAYYVYLLVSQLNCARSHLEISVLASSNVFRNLSGPLHTQAWISGDVSLIRADISFHDA
jgi:hypothetical protein